MSLLAQQMSHSSSGELCSQLGGGAAFTGGITAADIRGMPDNPHKYLTTLVRGCRHLAAGQCAAGSWQLAARSWQRPAGLAGGASACVPAPARPAQPSPAPDPPSTPLPCTRRCS